MATTTAPTLLSATRTAPEVVRLAWENHAATGATYTSMWVERRKAAGGTWARIASLTSGQIAAKTFDAAAPGGLIAYEYRLSVTGPAGPATSSSQSVGVWVTAPPAIVAAIRTGATTVQIDWTAPAAAGDTLIFRRRALPEGAAPGTWSTVHNIANPATSGRWVTYGLDGATPYEWELYTVQSSVPSAKVTATTAAWWQTPPPVTNLQVARASATDPTVVITWDVTAPAADGRNAPTAQIVAWASPTRDDWQKIQVSTSRRSYALDAFPERGYRVRVWPINAAGPSASIPEKEIGPQIQPPQALDAPTVALNGQGEAEIAWTSKSTADRPAASTQVIRTDVITGVRTVLGSVGVGVTTYRDRSLTSNMAVTYSLLPSNRAGSADASSPQSAEVATVPAGASVIDVERQGLDAVRVWWAMPRRPVGAPETWYATTATGWEVEHTTHAAGKDAPEGDWFPMVTAAAADRQWLHTSIALGVPHTYRIRPIRTGAPAAPWVYSPTLSAVAQPLPPTLIPPTSMAPSEPLRLAFTPNPIDGTPQSAAEVQHRKTGTSTWTTITLTTATQALVPAGTYTVGDSVEWRARTKHAAAAWSDWSPSSVVVMRTRPAVSLTAPAHGQTITGTHVDVAGTAPTASSWTVDLIGPDGNPIDRRTGTGTTITARFDGLRDAQTYSVRVVARDAYQDSHPVTATVTVALDRPGPPSLTAIPDAESATVMLSAQPTQGLAYSRRNYTPWPRFEHWPYDGLRGIVPAILGDGHPGAIMRQGSIMRYIPVVDGAASLSVDLSWASDSLPDTVTLAVGSEETVVSPPVWPEVTRYTATAVTTANMGMVPVRISTNADQNLYLLNPLAQAWSASTATPSTDWFDADSTRDGYVYGSTGTGSTLVTYEATPVTTGGDIPTAPTAAIRIERSRTKTGPWEPLDTTGTDWSLLDQLPWLGVPVWYRAVAVSEDGAETVGEAVQATVGSCDVWLNWGPGWSLTAHGGWNPRLAHVAGRDAEVRRYVSDNPADDIDTIYYGTRQARVASAQIGTGDDDGSPRDTWHTVAEHPGTVAYRDPTGVLLIGRLSPVQWSSDVQSDHRVSITVTEGR